MTYNRPNPTANYANMASAMASSPEAMEAVGYVQQTAREIQDEIQADNNEDWSLHVMSMLIGLAMIVVSVNGFVSKIVFLDWDAAFVDAFVGCVGVGAILMESGAIRLPLCATFHTWMERYVPPYFLSFKGRGVAFVIAGLMEVLYLRGLLDTIVGIFAIYVGGMFLYMAYRSRQKFETSGMLIPLEKVQEEFALADVDGKGSLTLPQFRQFLGNLDLPLDKRESEAAFRQLDKANVGRLTYESIHHYVEKTRGAGLV